ncbi:hypothetical protein [Bacillus wiedmannii]|uniref:hypothetical protein n=1 Tax=Bacillus wiedmannii TaxID=1890302 RepID=UPI000BF079C8|nr:hypothetical protein [Bacillus wiedmannii]PEM08502.1 hypothetical protein CN610_19815 [Bacillus wiedmannii]
MTQLEAANKYFEEEVLHNTVWIEADENTRKRALRNAENDLYEYFSRFDKDTRPLADRVVFEQAFWLLRKDDVIQKAEMGVTNTTIMGEVSISVRPGAGGAGGKISPTVIGLMRTRKTGRYR